MKCVLHCRLGDWNSGGQCHKETEPIFNDTNLVSYPTKMTALEDVLREVKAPITYMNISRLTDYRKDGHPSIYRVKPKNVEDHIQDCSHWCLPGVPDTWNELLYASLLKAGIGSWRNWIAESIDKFQVHEFDAVSFVLRTDSNSVLVRV